jgi:putative oxidoreductase
MNKDWIHGPIHDSARSLDVVRIAVAFILITHPIYALLHPTNVGGFGHILASHHIPFAASLAWAVMLMQAGCSLALMARRLVIPACVGHIFVLAVGIVLIHRHGWRTVGLPDGDHQPGAEFSVLLIACLLAIAWAHRRKPAEEPPLADGGTPSIRRAVAFVRIASAAILIIHPIGGLSDPAGLNEFGHYLSSIGFPCGVVLAWGAMFLQIASSLAIVAGRFVVPACFGHMLVLVTGIWLVHAPYWFVIGPQNVVGPGREGVEYSMLLITCFVSLLIAYWPKRIRS